MFRRDKNRIYIFLNDPTYWSSILKYIHIIWLKWFIRLRKLKNHVINMLLTYIDNYYDSLIIYMWWFIFIFN